MASRPLVDGIATGYGVYFWGFRRSAASPRVRVVRLGHNARSWCLGPRRFRFGPSLVVIKQHLSWSVLAF